MCFVWVGVLRASIGSVWVDPRCARPRLGVLILVMGRGLIFIEIPVLPHWLIFVGRLRAVLDVLVAVRRSGFSVSRGLELTRQWDAIVAAGPMGTVTADARERASGLGLADMEVFVAALHLELDKFLQAVVRSRKDRAVQGWKAWLLEDPLVHPYRWLRPDLFPLSPFLQCDPGETPDGSGVLADPALIDAKFREAWMPYFCRSGRGLLILMTSLMMLREVGCLFWMNFISLLSLGTCWLRLLGVKSNGW